MLDRLLILAENNDLLAIICANKVDLIDEMEECQRLFAAYEEIGYPVLYTSARTGQGVELLREERPGQRPEVAVRGVRGGGGAPPARGRGVATKQAPCR